MLKNVKSLVIYFKLEFLPLFRIFIKKVFEFRQTFVSRDSRNIKRIINQKIEKLFNLFIIFLAALYWLFVVNGPTPVVKARIEEVPIEQDSETDWTAIAFQILKAYFIPVIQQDT